MTENIDFTELVQKSHQISKNNKQGRQEIFRRRENLIYIAATVFEVSIFLTRILWDIQRNKEVFSVYGAWEGWAGKVTKDCP